jgi:hypothetical protein
LEDYYKAQEAELVKQRHKNEHDFVRQNAEKKLQQSIVASELYNEKQNQIKKKKDVSETKDPTVNREKAIKQKEAAREAREKAEREAREARKAREKEIARKARKPQIKPLGPDLPNSQRTDLTLTGTRTDNGLPIETPENSFAVDIADGLEPRKEARKEKMDISKSSGLQNETQKPLSPDLTETQWVDLTDTSTRTDNGLPIETPDISLAVDMENDLETNEPQSEVQPITNPYIEAQQSIYEVMKVVDILVPEQQTLIKINSSAIATNTMTEPLFYDIKSLIMSSKDIDDLFMKLFCSSKISTKVDISQLKLFCKSFEEQTNLLGDDSEIDV